MQKTTQDLSLSAVHRFKLAHSFASGADWKSYRVGVTARERKRIKNGGKVLRSALSAAQGFGK